MKRSKKIVGVAVVFALSGIAFIGFKSHGFAASGYRILQWTAQNQHTTLSELLLACGVPPSPYKEIYDWDYNADITDTPLHSAAKMGNIELARSLIEHHASIDWCCCSCVTPLHEAIINKRTEIVDLLLKSGANTDIPYDLSASVIELAKTKGTPEIVDMILSHEERLNKDRRAFHDPDKDSMSKSNNNRVE
jgi:ankyrin repeat protein